MFLKLSLFQILNTKRISSCRVDISDSISPSSHEIGMKTIPRGIPNTVDIQSALKGRFRGVGILSHVGNSQNLQVSMKVPEL